MTLNKYTILFTVVFLSSHWMDAQSSHNTLELGVNLININNIPAYNDGHRTARFASFSGISARYYFDHSLFTELSYDRYSLDRNATGDDFYDIDYEGDQYKASFGFVPMDKDTWELYTRIGFVYQTYDINVDSYNYSFFNGNFAIRDYTLSTNSLGGIFAIGIQRRFSHSISLRVESSLSYFRNDYSIDEKYFADGQTIQATNQETNGEFRLTDLVKFSFVKGF